MLNNQEKIIEKWNVELYELEETQTDDIEFAISVIGNKAKNLFEMACGSGRILVPLAKAGYNAEGIDIDALMLDKIKDKAKGLTNIKWGKGDIINDKNNKEYDAVIIAGNLLMNIITDFDYEKSQEILIQKATTMIKPGGYVYIDYGYTMHPENWFGATNERVIWDGTDKEGNFGEMILKNETFDKDSGIIKSQRIFKMIFADSTSYVKEMEVIKHFPKIEQVRKWLNENNCTVLNEYGDYEGNPITENTGRAILWAQKAE